MTKMAKFRKRSVTIEAMQFTAENKDRVFNWVTCSHYPDWNDKGEPVIVMPMREGDVQAWLGDWIIKDENGDFAVCKPDVFAATYEPVEEDETDG
jgi:hypothetical protein